MSDANVSVSHRLSHATQRLLRGVLTLMAVCGLLISMLVNPPLPAAAQGSGTIVLTGVVTLRTPDSLTVSSTTFKITPTTILDPAITTGSTVQVVGIVNADGTFTAQVVTLVASAATSTPLFTPTATLTPNGTLTSTPLASATPIVTATATGTVAQPMPYPFVIIIIDGPIQVIDVSTDVIVVYGYRIKLRDEDKRRFKFKVGDWVKVRGRGDFSTGTTTIIIVTIIVVVSPSPVVIVAPRTGGGGDDKKDHDDKGKHKGKHGDDQGEDD